MRLIGLLVTVSCLPASLCAQDPLAPHDARTLSAVLAFVDYDQTVPLHAEIVSADQSLGFTRQKLVFTGGQTDRVPGLLSIPEGPGPFPVVVLLHAGASAKETWWSPEGLERGALLTEELLNEGYAVLALDGEHHGERASSVDFVPIQTWYFEHQWWATFRSMVSETVTDYRRALDYLATRSDLDTSSVGAVGVSMGAITAVLLAAADSRVRNVVTASGALAPDWLYPITHTNLASGLNGRRVLTVVGDQDQLVDAETARLLGDLLDSATNSVHIYQGGHQPPGDWADLALEWLLGA